MNWLGDAPKLWPAVLYGLIALMGAAIQRQDQPLLMLLGGGLFLVGGLPAAVTVMVYLGWWGSEILDYGMRAATRTRQSTAAEAVRNLTADQLVAVRMTGEMKVGVQMAGAGPRYVVAGTAVPLDFLRFEYLPLCLMDATGVTHTAPIGSWSDGRTWKDYGQCRMLAKEFTQHLVANGLAIWGSGNQSARLVGNLTVLDLRKMLGLAELTEGVQ